MPESRDFDIPGDISSAAFWLVAAAAQPGGHLLIRDVGLNDTRTAMLGVLLRMGAHVREAIEDIEHIEPRGVVEVTGVPLKATVIQGKEVPQLIDELPILAVAAALASGKTIIRHAEELRVKETDRIAAIAHNLRMMGAQVVEMSDGLEIHGPAPLHGARLPSFGDHRIAMAFAVAGLFAEGETIIQDAECIRESYPGSKQFLKNLAIRSGCVQHAGHRFTCSCACPGGLTRFVRREIHMDHTLPNTVSSPLMVPLPPARAVSLGSLRDNLGLFTSTRGRFIERSPGIFLKTGLGRRKASVLLTRSIPRRSHAMCKTVRRALWSVTSIQPSICATIA